MVLGWPLAGLIRLYWILVPRRFRRRCIFSESCSHHVYRTTRALGGRSGLKALGQRVRGCRPGYSIEWSPDDGDFRVVCVDGATVPARDVAPHVLAPWRDAVGAYERLLNEGQRADADPRAARATRSLERGEWSPSDDVAS